MLLLLVVVLSACGTPEGTFPGLAAHDDTIYVVSGAPQRVYLLDAETGDQKAVFSLAEDKRSIVYWSGVAVGDELAYVGFGNPREKLYGLYAFDPETAQQRWQQPVEDLIVATPVYDSGTVYFGVSDGRLYAVEAETGTLKPGWPFQAKEAIWATPLVADGRLYVGAMDHHLYCLDAETGQLVWKFQAGGAVAASPILEDGILYFGAFDGKVYAVHADSGERVEGFDFQADNWIWSEPLLADGQLYVTSLDGKLYALDPSSGAVAQAYLYDAESPLRAAPVQAGDAIIVAAQSGQVTAVQSPGGGIRWQQWPNGMTEGSILTTPIVRGDQVYIVIGNSTDNKLHGKMYVLQVENGAQQPFFSPPEED